MTMPTLEQVQTGVCDWCAEDVPQDEIETNNGLCRVCQGDDARYCVSCDRRFHYDNMAYCDEHDAYYCDGCSCCGDDDTPTQRLDTTTTRYIGAQRGNLLQSVRTFGVEIECLSPSDSATSDIINCLPSGFGLTTDGSLSDGGIEIQTPKLAGFNGERTLRHACRVLNEQGCTIDRSCGLHVHLDTSDMARNDFRTLKHLWLFYLVFEDVLLSFLPRSRRGNTYCHRLNDRFHIDEIEKTASRRELEQIWYRTDNHKNIITSKKDKGHYTRYAGLNLHSLFHARHAEIRYHSGTMNADKILHWVNLHAQIFDYTIRSKPRPLAYQPYVTPDFTSTRFLTDMTQKTDALFDTLNLPADSRTYFQGRQQQFTDTTL